MKSKGFSTSSDDAGSQPGSETVTAGDTRLELERTRTELAEARAEIARLSQPVHERLAAGISDTLAATSETVKKSIAQTAGYARSKTDAASALMESRIAQAADTARTVVDATSNSARRTAEAAGDLTAQVEEAARRNPIAAIGAALLIGIIFGKIVGK